MKKRIGLFGGTFNPVHYGHIKTALEVKKMFCLDSVFFIPCALPPHKPYTNIVSAKQRMQMLKSALKNYPEFQASEIELKRNGISYTIDTVSYFVNSTCKNSQFYLIIGSDAFIEIDTWKAFDELFNIIPIIMMIRDDASFTAENIEWFLKQKISADYKLSAKFLSFSHYKKQPVFIAPVSPVDISSTKIRSMIKKNQPISDLTPSSVELFIKNKGLYA